MSRNLFRRIIRSMFAPESRRARTVSGGATRRKLRPRLELLEDRVVPTTDITFSGHILTIDVGANNETVKISEALVGGAPTLTVNSDVGTTADAAAVALGFSAN